MNYEELLAKIESLPKVEQLAIATSILDRLDSQGIAGPRERLRAEFLRREKEFLADDTQGQSWESVRDELFPKKQES